MKKDWEEMRIIEIFFFLSESEHEDKEWQSMEIIRREILNFFFMKEWKRGGSSQVTHEKNRLLKVFNETHVMGNSSRLKQL